MAVAASHEESGVGDLVRREASAAPARFRATKQSLDSPGPNFKLA